MFKKWMIKYGLVFVIFPVWFFLIVPEVESVHDFSTIFVQRGIDQIVPSYGSELSEPFLIEEITSYQVLSDSGDILEIKSTITGTDLSNNDLIFDFSETFQIDKFTYKHVDEKLGLFSFPQNSEKKDYFLTHPLVGQPADFIFQQEEKISDLNTYKFSCESYNNDATASFPQFVPYDIVIDYTCNIWIEPTTGNIINYNQKWETYFVEDGVRIQLAEIGGKQTTDYTISILADLTQKQLETQKLMQVLGPTVFGTLIVSMIGYDIRRKSQSEISKERKLHEQLSEQIALQQNLKKALDASSIVSILDNTGKITFVNDKFCEISKYSRDEIIGKHQNILRSGVHPKRFYYDLWNTILNGKVWRGEICNKAKDGTLFWTKVTIIPFLDMGDKITEYVSVRNDITEQKMMTEKLIKDERLKSIGELAARLAHDLRNPLSIIKTTNAVIKVKTGKDEYSRITSNIDSINKAVDRMSYQIDSVLDFIRTRPLVPEKYSIQYIIEKTLETINVPENVTIDLEKNDAKITCDFQRISIVFTNLITNAIQAIGKNSGEITIRIKEKQGEITCSVIDSGPGIPEDEINKVFEPLFTTKQTGTGLGLVSCKSVIEQHNGTISVHNNPTTFTITLPKIITVQEVSN